MTKEKPLKMITMTFKIKSGAQEMEDKMKQKSRTKQSKKEGQRQKIKNLDRLLTDNSKEEKNSR